MFVTLIDLSSPLFLYTWDVPSVKDSLALNVIGCYLNWARGFHKITWEPCIVSVFFVLVKHALLILFLVWGVVIDSWWVFTLKHSLLHDKLSLFIILNDIFLFLYCCVFIPSCRLLAGTLRILPTFHKIQIIICKFILLITIFIVSVLTLFEKLFVKLKLANIKVYVNAKNRQKDKVENHSQDSSKYKPFIKVSIITVTRAFSCSIAFQGLAADQPFKSLITILH